MRSLIIAFALLLPVVFIVLISGEIKPAPDIYHNEKQKAKIVSAVKPAPKANDDVHRPAKPGSLEAERERLRKRLAELDKLIEQEWQEQKKDRIQFNEKWNKLPPEKKLEVIEKLREKRKRAPEVELAPAKPESELPAKRPN